MSNYTKSTNFATKDNLTPGDPLKVVRGTEIDTEFNNIATAVATKTDNASAAITGGSITGITDLAVADGGTGASTAAGALNNLLPSQTSAANKYLQSDGTNASWDAVTLSTADITGTLAVANGGTGVTTSTGTGNVVLSNSPTLVTPALGTPASGTLTNATGLPISTGVSGLGTGVATFLGTPSSANLASAVSDETGSGALVFANSPTLVTPALGTPSSGVLTNATGLPISTGVSGLGTGVATFLATPSSANLISAVTDETGTGALVFATSPTLVTPALGTPSALVGTNITGTASGLTAGNVTTNANLTGAVTSVGNATSLGSFTSSQLAGALTDETGTGSAVFATSPTLVTPILGTPTSATLTNATGLPIATGVSGLGTGIATALAVNTGSAGAPVLFNGALGTPSSGTVTNLTGTASININGTVGATTATTGAFTSVTASTTLGVTGVSTLTGGAVVQGMTVGRGGGAVVSNTVLGNGAFTANSSGTNNVSIGYLTSRDSTGSDNVNIGTFRGYARTTGDGNTFVGTGTGSVVVGTGSNNCGVGMLSLVSLTSGYANSALGKGAGQNNETGSCNVYIGDGAGFYSTGFSNTFVGGGNTNGGYSSGLNVTSGVLNTFLGSASGRSVITGSYNTIIGAFAGSAADTNRVVLSDGQGNAIIDSGSNKTIALQNASSASGTGLTFPATQSASSNANTLDDYEEGTWTPTITYETPGTLSVTYSTQAGTYTKVGNIVTLSFQMRLSGFTKGTASGTLKVGGVPFNSGFDSSIGTIGLYDAPFSSQPIVVPSTASLILLRLVNNSGWASLDDPDSNSQYFGTATIHI